MPDTNLYRRFFHSDLSKSDPDVFAAIKLSLIHI